MMLITGLALKMMLIMGPALKINPMLVTGPALKTNMMLITGLALKTSTMLITGPALKTHIGLLALLGGFWTADGDAIVGRGAISLDFFTLLFPCDFLFQVSRPILIMLWRSLLE